MFATDFIELFGKLIMETIEINGNAYQLDVEKAKELGLLKDIKPRSWEEYCNIINCIPNSGYFTYNKKTSVLGTSYDVFKSKEEAKAFYALGKLIQLRDAWVGDWEPDWKKVYNKYTIINARDRIDLNTAIFDSGALAFPTKEMANDFLNTFRDLIEEAKMFL